MVATDQAFSIPSGCVLRPLQGMATGCSATFGRLQTSVLVRPESKESEMTLTHTARGVDFRAQLLEHNRLTMLGLELGSNLLQVVERQERRLVAGEGFEPSTFGL